MPILSACSRLANRAPAANSRATLSSVGSQLAVGGRIVMPMGREPCHQRLIRPVRHGEHDYHERSLGEVSFVPLIGEDGWAAH
ncbi:hypothetical protein [Paraburkholderia aspalathi]|uniref:hypothetical protein n=1 Tax=Paraburkholderia aspalathi TaxID=1324617 RepID=UPI00244B8C3C|nr:hypothetical protein [Paraburkholderia aspalathi]